jgi:Ulp1 protease family, C-terminal catalytic domain
MKSTSQPKKGKDVCSVNKQHSYDFSCYSTQDLKKIYEHVAPTYKLSKKVPKARQQIYKTLKSALANHCGDDETCWIKHPSIKNSSLKKSMESSLKPAMPSSWLKNRFTWLSSVDIYNAMKPYEKEKKDFLFLGPVPRDCPVGYQCILSGLDPKTLMESDKKTKIGIIYNLDLHDEPGSHWVAIYMDLKKGRVEYYDSYGSPPEQLIYTFMRQFAEKLDSYYKNRKTIYVDYNRHRHQYGGSECGMFSMVFLLQRLQGYSLNDIGEQNLTDKLVNELRFKLFRKPTKVIKAHHQ